MGVVRWHIYTHPRTHLREAGELDVADAVLGGPEEGGELHVGDTDEAPGQGQLDALLACLGGVLGV